jgi:hypothetical protein
MRALDLKTAARPKGEQAIDLSLRQKRAYRFLVILGTNDFQLLPSILPQRVIVVVVIACPSLSNVHARPGLFCFSSYSRVTDGFVRLLLPSTTSGWTRSGV